MRRPSQPQRTLSTNMATGPINENSVQIAAGQKRGATDGRRTIDVVRRTKHRGARAARDVTARPTHPTTTLTGDSMKTDPPPTSRVLPAKPIALFAPQRRAAARQESHASQDRVSADSPTALSVRAAEAEERIARAARRKKLQRAVENGSYRPSAEATATRMLDSARWIVELDHEIEQRTVDWEAHTTRSG